MGMEVSIAFGRVSWSLRGLRASLIGTVMMFSGVIGHVSAGGLLPGWAWLGTLFILNLSAATVLAGRPLPIRYIVLVIAGGQAFVHLALTLTAGHVGETMGPSIQMVDGNVLVAMNWHHLMADFSAHAPMMMAHMMAGATVGMWLGVGERALWALIAGAHTRLLRPLIVLRAALAGLRVPARGVLLGLPTVPAVRPRAAILARSVVRRGPPVLLAA